MLNEESLIKFVKEKIKDLGTSACPPYHLALVIGGTSAEATLKTVKEASAGYLDHLPVTGDQTGRAFRDIFWEKNIERICHEYGVGAQFGGKYFVHDVRVTFTPTCGFMSGWDGGQLQRRQKYQGSYYRGWHIPRRT